MTQAMPVLDEVRQVEGEMVALRRQIHAQREIHPDELAIVTVGALPVGEAGEGGCPVHNAGCDFNDRVLPGTASLYVRLVQRYLVDG